jgi:dienelactone hydrolase
MRSIFAATLFRAVLLLGAVTPATMARAATAEFVDIGDKAAPLRSVLFRPPGPGPFHAVVALHDCAGLISRSGKMVRRVTDWGERLSAAGLVVLFPDSFAPRGLGDQCRARERRVRTSRERVADAQAARKWLQEQSWVNKNRVSLLGWSSGAITALWVSRLGAKPRDTAPDFRSAVAFYPGCRRLGNTAWSARVPTLILIGGADDLTPAAACKQMVAEARGRTARADIVVYPGAYQGFDRLDQPVRVLTGLAYSADGSGRAHVGTNRAARTDALKRTVNWLSR